METTTFEIETENRVGITHDVIGCFLCSNISIIRMEVKPHYIYIKIKSLEQRLHSQLISSIGEISGVRRIDVIPFLPSEGREDQMNTILETVSEGMILLDQTLRVQAVNRAAHSMLPIPWDQLKGRPLADVWGRHIVDCRQCLESGIEVLNKTVTIQRKTGETVQMVASYYPIRSVTANCNQGIVIVIRDMKQISDLIQSVKSTGMVQFADIVHRSEEMARCIALAKRVARCDATIFLYGESGTGKELFARAIHYESLHADGPFVPVNCAAIPEALLESELFGYEAGAFTGAAKGGKKGLFEMAQGGTLFLDEVAELPLHLQAKLLHAVEERAVRRVGGDKRIPINLRIIAATNRDLSAMVAQGRFRGDLYYRLHVIPIQLPPLRERKSDIPLLASHFAGKFRRLAGRPPLPLSSQAMHMLLTHDWPGNVRELRNVIERSVYLYLEEEKELKKVHIENKPTSKGTTNAVGLKERMEAYEREIVAEALKRCQSVRQAARDLGISHTALLRKMRKYGQS
jgi:transcriptional regulator of aroF, aroG, tyrA and aromatic amino acid transport